jgi:hypothetical protein
MNFPKVYELQKFVQEMDGRTWSLSIQIKK